MEERGATTGRPVDWLALKAPAGLDGPWQREMGDATCGLRVCVVDDNDGLRKSIRDLLADAGIEVVAEAPNAAQALRAIPQTAERLPLVVLMDVRMPGPVNGIDLTRVLIERCPGIAVIVFTAFPGAGIEQAALRAGAVELLAKGCPAKVIIDAVRRAWSKLVPVDD